MKRVVAVVLFMALVLGTCSMALASEVSKPTIKEENVDLIVKVAQWATISKPNTMTLDLTEPGKSYSISQDIIIGTNTDATVTVSQPEPTGDNITLSEAIDAGAFSWGLGFQGEHSDARYPSDSFDVNASNEVTRKLVFWAEWKDNNWWKLPADAYKGTAVITVYAR
mgnify:CR=1 FL=1